MYLLETYNVTKSYKGKEAVSGLNMHVKKGEIYGFLGPNGAGKTTLMKMVTNLIKPTRGEIEIFGEKLTATSYEVLKRMGTIIEAPVFYEKLTARENLELHCKYMGYHDKKAPDTAMEILNIKDTGSKPVRDFSLGMKQRLGIARAIITKPEFLVLDEPINGLDPIGIKEIRSLLINLSTEYGITILISSHILAEIEQIADTIGVIDKGRLSEEVSMSDIRETNCEYIEIEVEDVKKAAFVLDNKTGIKNFKINDSNAIRIYEAGISQYELTGILINNDVRVSSITRKNSSLEDYFMKLMDGGGIIA